MAHNIAQKQYGVVYPIASSVVYYLNYEKKSKQALDYILGVRRRIPFQNTGDAILFQKDLGSCYAALKDYLNAEVAFAKMIDIEDKADNRVFPASEKAIDEHMVGNFYLKKKNYLQAKKHLEKSLQITGGTGPASSMQTMYLSMFKADSALNDYAGAMKNLRHYTLLKDSLTGIEKQKQIEKLRIAYDAEKKEKQIKDSQIQIKTESMKNYRLRVTRNWVIAAFGVFIVLFSLLYRISRIRKINNEQISTKNRQLTQLLEDKEWLLKEIHHRVKNNLHTVICLLESQAAYLDNEALNAIENSQHRIYAMALIHQKLYQSDDIKLIDMKNYLLEFSNYLLTSFGMPANVSLLVNVAPVKLSAAQAIPVGLIVNEAVTNSFKYAFPDHRNGRIEIVLSVKENKISLIIKDNGIGAGDHISKEQNSLGLSLIKGLTRDLHGMLNFEVSAGTCVNINFPKDELSALGTA
jgi:two-component sensor histidine kinase